MVAGGAVALTPPPSGLVPNSSLTAIASSPAQNPRRFTKVLTMQVVECRPH